MTHTHPTSPLVAQSLRGPVLWGLLLAAVKPPRRSDSGGSIDRTFSLTDVPQAVRNLREGSGRKGKIVITV
jgi:hypothetical protein